MGALYSRYNGAIHSKGEYILFVDSDDIVLKDGILNAYNYIKKKNLDMIEFHTVFDILIKLILVEDIFFIQILFTSLYYPISSIII